MKKLKFKKNLIILSFTALIFLSAILISAAASLLLNGKKADLTADKRYSLSDKSIKIAKNLSKPVLINVFLSENLDSEYPQLAQYSQFVLRYLEKYKAQNASNINIEIKNPEPFSSTEQEAQNNGIRGFLDGSGKNNLYFGAQFIDSEGNSLSIPYFSLQRQNYLEHDISRALAKFAGFKRKTVGIASFVMTPLYKDSTIDPDDWLFVKELKNDYNVVRVPNDILEIPSNIDVLLLINPRQVSKIFTYALDQYILRGGNLIIFLDPYSEYGSLVNKTPDLPPSGMQPLLENLGVSFNENIVVGDKNNALPVLVENKGQEYARDYYLWFNTEKQNINQENALTRNLKKLSFRTPGTLDILPKENAYYTRLFSTSEAGGHIPAHQAKFLDRHNTLNLFQADNKQYDLGYLIEGYFESIFSSEEFTSYMPRIPFIIGSIEKSKVMIIADTDFLFDSNWNTAEYDKQAVVYDVLPEAENSDFILNAVDYMSGNDIAAGIGSKELISQNKSIGTLLYERVFSEFSLVHKLLEEQLAENQNALNRLSREYGLQSSNLTLTAVKNLEKQQKEVSRSQNMLNHLDYDIQQKQQQEINKMILLNVVAFPLSFILLIWLIMKTNKYFRRKRALRDIHE